MRSRGAIIYSLIIGIVLVVVGLTQLLGDNVECGAQTMTADQTCTVVDHSTGKTKDNSIDEQRLHNRGAFIFVIAVGGLAIVFSGVILVRYRRNRPTRPDALYSDRRALAFQNAGWEFRDADPSLADGWQDLCLAHTVRGVLTGVADGVRFFVFDVDRPGGIPATAWLVRPVRVAFPALPPWAATQPDRPAELVVRAHGGFAIFPPAYRFTRADEVLTRARPLTAFVARFAYPAATQF
jgi:hypothetical protein